MLKHYILVTAAICLVIIAVISGVLLHWVNQIATYDRDETVPMEESFGADGRWDNGVISFSRPAEDFSVTEDAYGRVIVTGTEALPRAVFQVVEAGTAEGTPEETVFSQFALDVAERYFRGGLQDGDTAVTAVKTALDHSSATVSVPVAEIAIQVELSGSGTQRLLAVALLPDGTVAAPWMELLSSATIMGN